MTEQTPKQMKAEIDAFHRYSASIQTAAAAPVPKAEPLRSPQELTTAIADPRYSRDAAYRSDVEARIASGLAAGHRLT